MTDTPEHTEKPIPAEPDKLIACEICLKEIPTTEAHHMEAEDYVHHFCGLNCLELWHTKVEQEEKAAKD